MRAVHDVTPLPGDGVVSGLSRVVVCVDDTDDLTKETSTGAVAEAIATEARELGGHLRFDITRHQLLIAEGVPYTSHNSAMAFDVMMDAGAVPALKRCAVETIAQMRAESSDPGLCIAVVPQEGARTSDLAEAEPSPVFEQIQRLVAFGWRAKAEICTKRQAYDLAASIPWVDLGEYGGDGAGVVGALAGVGLRLSGADGRFRGKWNLAALCDAEVLSVSEVQKLLAARLRGPVRIVDASGSLAATGELCQLSSGAKPVLADDVFTVVCERRDGMLYPCAKTELEGIGNGDGGFSCVCEEFEWDNDAEECEDARVSCRNCLNRRWVAHGFECVKGN